MLREQQLQAKGEFTGLLRKHLEQELSAVQGMPALGDTHRTSHQLICSRFHWERAEITRQQLPWQPLNLFLCGMKHEIPGGLF